MLLEKRDVPKIVFGNLSLLGISYQGRERDEENKKKYSNKGEMKSVMRVALQHGVRVFAASSPGFNELAQTYLDAIKEIEREDNEEIRLIPCLGVPLEFKGERINDYKRWKTHVHYESERFGKEVRKKVFEDPVLNCRLGWREHLTEASPYDLRELQRGVKIKWKLWEENIEVLSHHRLAWVEPGSETDFLAISRIDLLGELLDRTRALGYRVLLGSHHIGASVPLLEENRVTKFDGYVTPVNKLGVMMFPTQRTAENVIRRTRKGGKLIVGIKPFAGGRINPKEALNYVYTAVKADSCMIGVGSVEEAKEDFEAALSLTNSIKFVEK